MKKLFCVILIVCLALSSCSQTATKESPEIVKDYEDLSKYTVNYIGSTFYNEDIANTGDDEYDIVESVTTSNSLTFSEIDDLYDQADYVVIATPTISYAESEQFWLDNFNQPVDFSAVSLVHSYSVRPFKVQKVFKGDDLKIKEIMVCENIVLSGTEMKACDGSSPLQQGDKYLLFLFESNNEDGYFPLDFQGAYNLNDSKNTETKHIDKEMLKQVKERFKDEFK